MKIKFEEFISEKKLIKSIFQRNPLKEIVLNFLHENDIDANVISSETDKYKIYDIYLKLVDVLKSNDIDSRLREGTAYLYMWKGEEMTDDEIMDHEDEIKSENHHFWLESDKWIIDIFPLSAREEETNITLFYNNENDRLYNKEYPLYKL